MMNINKQVDGPFILEEDAVISGQVVGDLIVLPGISLRLRGQVTGNLVAHAGANVDIDGMVVGRVVDQGATIVVNGMVCEGIVNPNGGNKE